MALAIATAHFGRTLGHEWLPLIVPLVIAIGIAAAWLLGIGLNGLSMVPINAVGILCGTAAGVNVSLERLACVAIGAGAGVVTSRYLLYRRDHVTAAEEAIDSRARELAGLLNRIGDAVRRDTVSRGEARGWLEQLHTMTADTSVDDALTLAQTEARYGLVGRERRGRLIDLGDEWGRVALTGTQVRGIARTLHDAADTGVHLSLPPVVADAVLLASESLVGHPDERIDPTEAAEQLRGHAQGKDILTSAAVLTNAMRIVGVESGHHAGTAGVLI
jgi:hypothetical protein